MVQSWKDAQLCADAASRGCKVIWHDGRVVGRTRLVDGIREWMHDGFGENRCLRPIRRQRAPDSVGLHRCGGCDNCVRLKDRRAINDARLKLDAEIAAASATYWVTLTFDRDVSVDGAEAAVKQFVRVLRLGRCRSRAVERDALGRPKYSVVRRTNGTRGKGVLIFEGPLPEVAVIPRLKSKRVELGFIEGDPKARFIWVMERTKAGRIHVHMLIHVGGPLLGSKQGPGASLIPPGAIPEAWKAGIITGVRVCGRSEEDKAKLGNYISKYMAKQAGKLGNGSDRAVVFRTSSRYGKVRQ